MSSQSQSDWEDESWEIPDKNLSLGLRFGFVKMNFFEISCV